MKHITLIIIGILYALTSCKDTKTAENTNDMQQYLSVTQDLVSEGKHQKALDRFIWFHENALEHDPAMYGVRLSFALRYWKDLGEVYPPALEALVKIRDEKEKQLQLGKGDKSEKSIELFELISKTSVTLADEYWDMIKDYVLESKRYDIAQKYITDMTKEFNVIKAEYDSNVKLYKDPQFERADFRSYNENNFVEKITKLVELALALEDRKSAIFLRDSAIRVLDDKRLKSIISNQ